MSLRLRDLNWWPIFIQFSSFMAFGLYYLSPLVVYVKGGRDLFVVSRSLCLEWDSWWKFLFISFKLLEQMPLRKKVTPFVIYSLCGSITLNKMGLAIDLQDLIYILNFLCRLWKCYPDSFEIGYKLKI